jgi:hypothetical protein
VRARSSAAFLVAVSLLAGCGGDDDDGASSQDAERCVAKVVWEDEEYLGADVRLPAERGAPLGEATIPACGPNDEREVQVARIPGVDPSVALANPADSFTVWVAESARAQEYPEALERILFGLSCDETAPFTLAGRLVGVSDRDEPLYVQVDVERTDAPGEAYRGVVIDLAIRDSTDGVSGRDEFSPRNLRLRARVRCVDADRPDRTFLAERIDVAGG